MCDCDQAAAETPTAGREPVDPGVFYVVVEYMDESGSEQHERTVQSGAESARLAAADAFEQVRRMLRPGWRLRIATVYGELHGLYRPVPLPQVTAERVTRHEPESSPGKGDRNAAGPSSLLAAEV